MAVPRVSGALRLLAVAFAASLFSSLYAQNIFLVALNPSSGTPGTAVTLTATGFASGVAAPPVTVTLTGATTLMASGTVQGTGVGRSINFVVPAGTAGVYNVSVSGSGLSSSNTRPFTLLGPPSFSLNPTSGPQGATLTVDISLVNSTFPGTATARFGPGIQVGGAPADSFGPLQILTSTLARATLTIVPGATLGLRTVQVTGLDAITQADAFTVTPGTLGLTLVSVNPTSGSAGVAAVITATGFSAGVASPPLTVTMTPQFAGPTLSASATPSGTAVGRPMGFTIPAGAAAGAYTLTVAGPGYTSLNSLTFTVTAPPSFTLSPVTGAQGATVLVTITGSNTTFPGGTIARFGPGISVGGSAEGQFGSVSVQPNGTAIATLVINPAAAIGTRSVDVTGLDSMARADAFAVTSGTRTLTLISISPTSGVAGSAEVITATGFELGAPAPGMTVTMTPQFAGPVLTASTTPSGTAVGRPMGFTVPAGAAAGIYSVTVAGPGYTSGNSLTFTVTAPGFTLSPATGAQGSTIQVIITGSNTTFPNGTVARFGPGISVGGAAEGQFGPVAVQPNGTAIATLVINPAATLGSRTVDVTGLDAITRADAFNVTSGTRTLTLISINPSSGVAGVSAVITATGFEAGVVAPALTVTMTPQFAGPTLTASTTPSGTAVGRPMGLTVPAGAAPGVYTVTVAGPGYSSGNSLTFTVTAAPNVTLNPTSGNRGAVLQVVITGSNTSFPSGTTVRFGPGISVGGAAENTFGPVSILSPTSLQATITISAAAALGGRTVEVNGLDAISQSNAFTVLSAEPQILSVIPNSAQQNQTLNVTLTGANTNFSALSTISFGSGVTVNSVIPNSATSLTANITVLGTATPGSRNVTVTTGSETVVGAGLFTVLAAPPGQITAISPGTGQQGQSFQITVTGVNTNFTPLSVVTLGGGVSVGPVTVNSATSISATITIAANATPGVRDVTVTTGGTPLTGVGLFTVTATPPAITSISPNSAQQGQSLPVTITGSNTNFTPGSTISLGSGITTGPVTFNSATSLSTTLTIAAGATVGLRDVTVTTDGTPVTGVGLFNVAAAPPQQLTSVTPPTGQQGQTLTVTINGANTTFSGVPVVTFGAGVTVNSASVLTATSVSANITVAANASIGSRDVTVTTNGTPVTGTGLFAVTAAPPSITSVAPNSGVQGQNRVVTITGANTNFSSASEVSFGSGITVQSFSVGGPGSLTASIVIASNATPGSRNVTVTTDGAVATGANLFTVIAAPTAISGITPNSGRQGQSFAVTITGTNTNFTAASVISLGDGITVGPVTLNSSTSLTATIEIASNATTGSRNVTVTTNGTPISAEGLFSVLPSLPQQISAITPNSGRQGQTLSVVITGVNTAFRSHSTTSFGPGITINSVTHSSDTSLTANITIADNAALGPRDVSVTTSGVSVMGAGLFLVTAAPPAITSITPNTDLPRQSFSITITGAYTNFSGESVISLGNGITVGPVTSFSATSVTAAITIDPEAVSGPREVTVTTNGTAVVGANLFSVGVPGSNGEPLTCRASSGVPPLICAEGFTELTGDILIICAGGATGQVSTVNLQLFLNTPLTSRVTNGQSEALLIVDELSTSAPATPGMYRATPAQGDNSVVWAGVPIVAPGPGAQRVLRITNVRSNASVLGISPTLSPTAVMAFLSVSPSNSLPIANGQLVVGYIRSGISFDVTNCNNTASVTPQFVQCAGENFNAPQDLINGTAGNIQFSVRFTEGFHTAFKTQIEPAQLTSLPGVVYNSESGFVRPELPYSVGGASSGTRLAARFTNVPAGVRLFVTTRPSPGSASGLTALLIQTGPNGEGSVGQPGQPNGVAETGTLFCPLAGGEGIPSAEIPVTDGSAMAVWEVTAANPAALETAVFGVAVAYAPDTPNRLPGLGQTSVSGNFAPFYRPGSEAGVASSSLPIPRFVDTPNVVTAFRIDSCTTNLLFPFVTNRYGFDTGIAISNTSRDPFGNPSRPQSGACALNYYGSSEGAPPPSPQKSEVVEPGSTMAFVVSSGGSHGITATPGFQGYMIVQCDFRYGHGFAFLSDGPIGAARVAEGYIGLVMDGSAGTRGTVSESLNQ